MALHRFCKAIVEHEPLHIFGDGQHLLGYAPQISLREGLVRLFASIVDLYRAIPGRMVA
jgi:hypothetical protein